MRQFPKLSLPELARVWGSFSPLSPVECRACAVTMERCSYTEG